MNITELSLRELAGALGSRQISSVEAASAYLAAIKEKEPSIGAFITVT